MIRSTHLHRTRELGLFPVILLGLVFVALVGIAFSSEILPVKGSAARPQGEDFPWAMLR